MAKNKLKITDIQKALLTNTRFIKEQEEEVVQETVPEVSAVAPPPPPPAPPVPQPPPAAPVPAPTPAPAPVKTVPEVKVSEVQIDAKIMKKMRILAAYQKTTPGELINLALDHYLRLKAMQLEEAMHKLTTE
ncbi:MAG: hypothetical protein U0T82_00055 [Bacteroidales bacterium]